MRRLTTAIASGLLAIGIAPALALPQWIDIGESQSNDSFKLDYNSFKRSGNRVGFTSTITSNGKATAYFIWVDCKEWQWLLADADGSWDRIAANSMIEHAAKFACTNSAPTSQAPSTAMKPSTPSRVPKGVRGKCSFYPKAGDNVIRDSCLIDNRGATTTLYWSDGVYSEITLSGSRADISGGARSDFVGRVVSRKPTGAAVEYDRGTIFWCWNC
ncbi:hypothetical protein KQ313_01680 [Synechococcus sp. CS-1325]|uniref:hypothetical protein n=1 Tax=Synechococcus sp. CS-1325 TaxID=2847979 RepID=UPI00223BA56D|nr:hypothetical protein [Synechococcus sp. CS-1325]MCT0198398.1 hypothetical protein [Synechococcus sp. CS-1325]